MAHKSLLIIGSSAQTAQSEVVEQTLAHWPADVRPKMVRSTLVEVLNDERSLAGCAAAWVVLEQPTCPRLYELTGLLQDHHLPTILSRPADTRLAGAAFQPGIVLAPAQTDPATLCIMWRTTWAQAEMVDALNAEVRLLRAHQGGLCDQIGKFDEELRLAAQLQREFLPQSLPSVGSVQFRVLYRPAGYVSGDIYDVIRLDEEHVGFYLADAVGHGVPAALMTVYIKRSLPTREVDPSLKRGYRLIPPDEALAQLNHDMLRQQTSKVRFATACYGIINTRTLELSFARAGHPYPMILRSDGSVDWLNPDGGLLGVFPDEQFELTTTRLCAGDRLLVYSDGFEVAFPEAKQFVAGQRKLVNNTRYTDEFKDLANGSLDEAVARLAGKLDQQAGSLNQLDDMTALLIGVGAAEDEQAQPDGAADTYAESFDEHLTGASA